MMNEVRQLLNSVQGTNAWFLICGTLLACGFGVPLPEEPLVILAGSLAFNGRMTIWGALTSCFVGIVGGDIVLFLGGVIFREKIVRWMISKGF